MWVGTQPPQGAFYRCPDHLWPGIGHQRFIDRRAALIEMDAEFGGNDHFVPVGAQRPSQQLFVVIGMFRRAIYLGSVKKGTAQVYGLCQQFLHLFLVRRRAVGMAHAHAPQSHGGDFQVFSQCAVFHKVLHYRRVPLCLALL